MSDAGRTRHAAGGGGGKKQPDRGEHADGRTAGPACKYSQGHQSASVGCPLRSLLPVFTSAVGAMAIVFLVPFRASAKSRVKLIFWFSGHVESSVQSASCSYILLKPSRFGLAFAHFNTRSSVQCTGFQVHVLRRFSRTVSTWTWYTLTWPSTLTWTHGLVLSQRNGTEVFTMFDQSFEAGSVRWPVVRIKPGGTTKIVVCAERFLPVPSHWVGHTCLCPGDGCELCELLPVRGLFYLAVVWGGRPSILELSCFSSSNFEQHCKLLHGGVRPGLEVELRRKTQRGIVRSEVVGEIESAVSVPIADFVGKVMALYHFPGVNPGESFSDYESRLSRMALARAKQERRSYESRSERGVQGRR